VKKYIVAYFYTPLLVISKTPSKNVYFLLNLDDFFNNNAVSTHGSDIVFLPVINLSSIEAGI